MQVWIGTSGYVYPEWKGILYPRGSNAAKMLSVYAENFPVVELNFSYYQMPTADQLARMASRVPGAFQFAVKAHRSLTHERDDRQIAVFAACLEPLRRGGQLAGVLCQFPQRFHRTDAHVRWLEVVRNGLNGVRLVVEFRHDSWDHPEINDWLRVRKIVLTSVDVPDLPSLFPRKLVQTSGDIYLRLHSRRASSWHDAGADRYDYCYSDAELQEWIEGLTKRADAAERAWILFNNCRRGNAVINARRMSVLLSQHVNALEMVAPASPTQDQSPLFQDL